MKIAIPLTNNTMSQHFGHCEQFAVYEMSSDGRSVAGKELLTPPPHEPGVFPAWLAGLGVNLIVAGGMGRRALDLFAENGIQVSAGVTGSTPEDVLQSYLDNALGSEEPTCNHDGDHHCG